ncbi:rab-GTPase-TBC domain-containing protein [Geopyxis carbonaria]|nr:rab-GTPase-TBC domain-containing protein [Geopyxis carbonaria]
MNGIGIASPPDLGRNGIGSSRNSTLTPPSSLHLDDGGILGGLNDFEEIGLSDDPDLERGRSGMSRDRMAVQRGNSAPLNTLRDLTHAPAKRPPYPSVLTNISSHPTSSIDHLSAPQGSSRSKNLTSQSTSALNRSGSRNRSPVPQSAHPNGVANGVSNGLPRVSPHAPKRTSWQRKTSDQLEEEYDSDDEVPPDTIFYNIPLSPRSSKAFSAAPSPERESSTERNGNGKNGNITPPTPRQTPQKTANIPISIPKEVGPRPESRSKSWSDAMQELGHEAKELSEALERHADEELHLPRPAKQEISPASTPKRFSADTKSVVELPPLQTTNGMIDPLPISKEKQAVLSRTRPSWLPPKSKEEEKRHLKEYQRIMRRSQDAERKRVEKERQEHEARERMKTEFHNVWEKQIIPNWNTASRSPETRELWWKGVAPRCRGSVWQLSFGNHLSVSSETFRLALKRAKEIEIGVKKAPSMYTPKERELFVSIKRDVMKTFPEMKIFQVSEEEEQSSSEKSEDGAADLQPVQETGPLHGSLIDVLMAYSMYRSDVGYVYGTHVVAGLLLLNLSADQAFVTLANILNRPLPLAFFTQDEGAMSRAYGLFLKAFQYKLPSLHRHMHINLGLDPMYYLEPMFLTLFSLHCPVDITSRIWDVYAFEGDSFLVRCAVAVLTVLESKLYGDRNEVLSVLGWNAKPWALGKEDEFMTIVRSAGKEEKEKGPAGRF